MKKNLSVALSAALFLVAGFSAHAQFGRPGGASPDSALTKVFGTNLNFSANMQVEIKMPEMDNDMSMAGKIYFSHGDARTELDMTQMKGSKMPPHTVEQMKAMGMDKMISISKPEDKTVYMVYPGLESYAKISVPKQPENANDAKIDTTKLGTETINGHPCEKNKYIVTDNGQELTMLAWLATDLKNYPIKIVIDSSRTMGGKTVSTDTTLNFTDVDITPPAASLFEPPTDYRAYNDIQTMVQSEMMKKMQQMGGANGMPPNHPALPPGHP